MSKNVSTEVDAMAGVHEQHTAQDEEAMKSFVARILEEAKSQGATAAEVSAGDDVGLSVAVREGDLETVEFSRDRGFGITVFIGQQKGSTSTTDVEDDSIRESVRAAIDIAQYTEPDPYSGLADPELLATEFPDLDLYHPQEMDVEGATEDALTAETSAMEYDPRIYKIDGTRVASASSCSAYGNSHGFLHAERGSRYIISAGVIAKSEFGMQTDYWYTTSRNVTELETPEHVGETAAKRTLLKLDPRPIPTGEYPVLFDSSVASGLIMHMMSALGGRAQYLKASYLLDSMGKSVATSALTLREHPHIPGALASRSHDSEGVATREKSFVEQGVVQNYVLSSYSGRHLNMPTTGNASGVCNLTVEADLRPIEAIVKEMDKGLVVMSLMGQGVNPVTGDYSRGAAGYWIENGEFAHAVDELTVAGKLGDMFQNMVAFGSDVDLRHNVRTGSILIESMTVAAN